MSNDTNELIRPSALPKLAVCRCFVGKPGTSEAAERGTRMDAAIRKAVSAGTSVDPADLDCVDADIEACNWAVDQLKELAAAGGGEWETREEELRAVSHVEGIADGTMDALNVAACALADFKSGQVRSYLEQMAAYSLSCMEEFFSDRWTAHLLFMDARERVTHVFTAEEARCIVEGVRDRERREYPCEYCAWCARFDGGCGVYDVCPAVLAANAEVLEADLPKPTPALLSDPAKWPESVTALAEDPAKAFRFLQCLSVAEKWGEKVKALLKEKVDLPARYFKRVTVSGQRKVYASQLVSIAERWGVDEVLALCGLIPYAEFEKAWKTHEGEDTPIPDGLVGTFGGSVQLRLGTGEEPKASAAAKGSGVTRKKVAKKSAKVAQDTHE